jgi:small subunit ribosomal protein S12
MLYPQVLPNGKFRSKPKNYRRKALENCPQKKGTCLKVFKMTPKKPCSAMRSVARVTISTGIAVNCHIPGETHNLRRYSTVLVRGHRVRDLPGIKYRVIHGKFDLHGLTSRKTRRSIYGIKKFVRGQRR